MLLTLIVANSQSVIDAVAMALYAGFYGLSKYSTFFFQIFNVFSYFYFLFLYFLLFLYPLLAYEASTSFSGFFFLAVQLRDLEERRKLSRPNISVSVKLVAIAN